MRSIFLAGLLLAVSACGGGGADDTGYGTNTDDLYDTWVVTSAKSSGAEMPKSITGNMRLVLTDSTYEVELVTGLDLGDLTIDDTTSPPRMDITGTRGPNAGQTYKAIYKQGPETLIISYDVTGAAYPTDFESKPGRTDFVVTYKRME